MKRVAGRLILPFLLLLLSVLPRPAGAQTPTLPLSTPPANAPTVSVVVAVENGTPGASVPPGVALTLYALDGAGTTYTREGISDALGQFRFDDLPYQTGRGFGAVARIGATMYVSEVAAPLSDQLELTLPLRVYETTTDASHLSVAQANMYVYAEALQEGKLQFINAYVLSNAGDRTIEGGVEVAGGDPGSVRFPLPKAAQDVRFDNDDGSRYARTGDGFVTRFGLSPGTENATVVVRYSLPYTDGLRLESTLAYPVDIMKIYVATQGITLTSSLLANEGTQVSEDGQEMNVWGAEKVAANQKLTLELNGKPQSPAPEVAVTEATPARSPVIEFREVAGFGLIALGLLVALAACVWGLVRLRPRRVPVQTRRRELVRALADLEEDFEAGRVEDDEYAHRRATLVEVLSATASSASTLPDAS